MGTCCPDAGRGRTNHSDRLNGPADEQALRQKLVEEAQGVARASEGDLVTELADLREVREAFTSTAGLSEESVRKVQVQGGTERRPWRENFSMAYHVNNAARPLLSPVLTHGGGHSPSSSGLMSLCTRSPVLFA